MTDPTEKPLSDEALLARVRRGDEAAFGELYQRHVGGVRRYARLCCRDSHLVEDLTAEVFARTLRLVRAGAGPDASVRGYLLTTLRRVAAQWGAEGRMEQPVAETEQLAPAGRSVGAPSDALALSRADRSMAARAFRSLPERWRAVLWHTTVENEPVSRVAPLLGLTPNATAVLAFRAREGLRTAYLQAHVSSSLTRQEECREYAGRLGAYARGSSRRRGFRALRRHLDGCTRCRSAYLELVDLNATLRGLVPAGLIAFFTTSRIAGGSVGIAAELSPAGAVGAVGAVGAGGVFGKAAVTASFALATGAMAVVPMPAPLPGPGQQGPPAATAVVDPGGPEPGGEPADALHLPEPSGNASTPALPAQRQAPESAPSDARECPPPDCDTAAADPSAEAGPSEASGEAAAGGSDGAGVAGRDGTLPETAATPATPTTDATPATPATPTTPLDGAVGRNQDEDRGQASGRVPSTLGRSDDQGEDEQVVDETEPAVADEEQDSSGDSPMVVPSQSPSPDQPRVPAQRSTP
ncbi:sigma-70 family RNA polymerase sigma factor [Streptomyces sp. 8K308]|uniref:sigma factor n=1 Tax=Streptomyces sp. 8K308 TaxID=2530388 RepID=UPI001FB761AE|nr:sigma-70 family RNA polymerase sigma factor [Streptomyces sp. 8K308]